MGPASPASPPTVTTDRPVPVVADRSAERAERGRSARVTRPRSSLSAWQPAPHRFDPIGIFEDEAQTRVPELLPIRYGRMSDSAFAFYRGSAAIMAADLGPLPNSGLTVQLCGDAHLANFGGFAAPDRELVFDLNDFDETHPGPFEWDLQRLAASFEVAGRSLGFGASNRSGAVLAMAESYRSGMQDFAKASELDIWYARLGLEGLLALAGDAADGQTSQRARKSARGALNKDRYRALARLTEGAGGDLRFRSDPPLMVRGQDLFPELTGDEVGVRMREILAAYASTLPHKYRRLIERYEYVDLARKVVGVGSVGSRSWVVLLVGSHDDDVLFLQVKQAGPSVLEPFTAPTVFSSHGERVVAGQSVTQAASDIFLGWATVTGPDGVPRDYYVRQIWDWKVSASIETMTAKRLIGYARVCGWTLAHAHARTGDPVAISGYVGKGDVLDRALAGFASAYADQNDRDYEALRDAIASGRVEAAPGI